MNVIYGLINFLHVFYFVCSTFNFEELKTNHYTFQLLSEPVLKSQDNDGSIMYMMSKYGQQYECNLPDILSDKNKNNDESAEDILPITELLKPLASSSCLIKVRDWWTYEFCYGKQIKQYHYEDGKGVMGPEISLGYFQRDYDWSNITDDSPNKKMRYHSQYYTNGTKCDLTDKPRQTEVRFFCDEDIVNHYSLMIDEPSSCQYIIQIRTDKICKHPSTRPALKIKPKQISCSPVLSSQQYTYYQHVQQEKKKKAEEKKKKWVAKEMAKLNEMKDKKAEDTQATDNTDNTQHLQTEQTDQQSKPQKLEDQPQVNTAEETTDAKSGDNSDTTAVQEEIEMLEGYLKDQMQKLKQQSNQVTDEGSKVEEKPDDAVTETADLKTPDDTDGSSQSANEQKDGDKNKKVDKLFDSVNDKLSKAGIKTDGQNFKLKIVRVNDDNEVEEWSDQSSEDVTDFVHKTIIAYVQGGGRKESLKQMLKQEELEKNYKFVWKKTEDDER